MPIEMPIDIPMHLVVERRGGRIEITPARSLPLRSWLGGWIAGAIVALAAHGVMVALSRLNIVTAPLILILVAYFIGFLIGLIGVLINLHALQRARRTAALGPLVTINPASRVITLLRPDPLDGPGDPLPFSSLLGVHIHKRWFHLVEGEMNTVRALEDLSLELRDTSGNAIVLPLLVNHRAGPSRKAAEALAREMGVPLQATTAPRKEMLFPPKPAKEKA